MNNIDKKFEIIVTKRGKATILTLYYLFKKALNLILIKKGRDKENLDLENSF